MKNKTIDITNYDDFIDNGFKECPKCNWAFAPGFFDNHDCNTKPAHNHIDPEKGKEDCPTCNVN